MCSQKHKAISKTFADELFRPEVCLVLAPISQSLIIIFKTVYHLLNINILSKQPRNNGLIDLYKRCVSLTGPDSMDTAFFI